MHRTRYRRIAMMILIILVLAVVAQTAFASRGISSAQLVLAGTGFVFGYIVIRLSESLASARPDERRKARRGLMIAAVVPALIFTPSTLLSAPAEYADLILIGGAVWIALALSYTSYVLAGAEHRIARDSNAPIPLFGERPPALRSRERRTRVELDNLWHVLMLRGAALMMLGGAAVLWPDEVLIPALILVGVLATLFGLYELSIAIMLKSGAAAWWIVLVHGLASLLFGALTVTATGLSMRISLAATCGWLLLYAGVVWSGAILSWPMRHIRWTLLIWGIVNVALAVVAAAYPEETIFAMLIPGALYAALYGAWQLAAGLWLRHSMRSQHPRGHRREHGRIAHAT